MAENDKPMTAAEIDAHLKILETSGNALKQMAEGLPKHVGTVRFSGILADMKRHAERVSSSVARIVGDRATKRSRPHDAGPEVSSGAVGASSIEPVPAGANGPTGPVPAEAMPAGQV